jgi:peptide/nickel transport system permease protein
MASPDLSADAAPPADPIPAEGPGGDEGAAAAAPKPKPKSKMGIGGWLSLIWLVLLLVLVLFAPVLPFKDPGRSAYIPRQPMFSGENLFGTDTNGRDVLARVAFGARVSIMIGVGAVVFGMVIGGALGLYAGYFRNRVSTAIAWVFDVLLAFPALVLALALVAVLASAAETSEMQRNLVIILALGIISVPLLGRIVRGATLSWSQREFVLAARSLGAKDLRIMVREVLPNVLPALFSIALLSVAVAIVAEGALALLGAGTTSISWGSMIAGGRGDLQRLPHVVMVPSAAIFLTVLALNYLGDIARSRFDVRESLL